MIIITGAAGFIGARLVEHFSHLNKEIISVDELPTFTSRIEHQNLKFGKCLEPEALFEFVTNTSKPIEAILHIGACSSTTETREDYLRKVNLEYSQRVWKLCTGKKIPLLYASSGATYGGGEHGFSDDEKLLPKLKPLNLYGWSKQWFDLWVLDQERAGLTPPRWSGFKFFNVYGFGERHKGAQASVVLHAFDQIRKNGSLKLFKSHREGIADGQQKRDFVSVEDVVSTMDYFHQNKILRGIYNLGTGRAQSFLDLAHATFRALKTKPNIEFIETPANIRDQYQYFTEAPMQKVAAKGYAKPFMNLETGVDRYVKKLLEL